MIKLLHVLTLTDTSLHKLKACCSSTIMYHHRKIYASCSTKFWESNWKRLAKKVTKCLFKVSITLPSGEFHYTLFMHSYVLYRVALLRVQRRKAKQKYLPWNLLITEVSIHVSENQNSTWGKSNICCLIWIRILRFYSGMNFHGGYSELAVSINGILSRLCNHLMKHNENFCNQSWIKNY